MQMNNTVTFLYHLYSCNYLWAISYWS